MKRFMHLALLLVALAACAVGQEGYAQRRINPVKSASKGIEGKNENRNPNDSIDYSKLAHMHDAAGNVILVDTITGKEVADTTQTPETKIPKMKFPLFHAAAVGVDVWDPVMRLFGQHYGLIEFSGELNLHHKPFALRRGSIPRPGYIILLTTQSIIAVEIRWLCLFKRYHFLAFSLKPM